MILQILMVLFIGYEALSGRSHLRAVVSNYRLSMLPECLLVLVLNTAFMLALRKYTTLQFNPISWLIGSKSGGNIIFSVQSLLYLPLLAAAIPSLAHAEEALFREGTVNWASAVPRSLLFGLAHVVMLVPLSALLCLALNGLWYTRHYFRGGVKRSTAYHAMYNHQIVLLVFLRQLYQQLA